MSSKVVQEDQAALAAKAVSLRDAGAKARHHPTADAHPADGFKPVPRPDHPPSGAFDAEGHRPVLERSRKER